MRASQLIPHTGAAVLLDDVEQAADADRISATFTVRPDTSFSAPDGTLPLWAGIEVMAQLVSALATIEQGADAKPAVDLLVGVRDYTGSCTSFYVGRTLTVEVTRSMSDAEGFGVFDGVIRDGEQVLAHGILSGYRLKNAAEFLVESQPQ